MCDERCFQDPVTLRDEEVFLFYFLFRLLDQNRYGENNLVFHLLVVLFGNLL